MAKDVPDLIWHRMQEVGIPRERKPEAQGDVRLPQGTVVVSVDNHYSVSEDIWWEKFPASMKGNADIRARVKLPEPCIAPIVFVASPTGAWFAATGS